jgi:hypothetical protein
MSIEGKRIALTGKFTTMKRAEASKGLQALGAIVVSGASKNVDILVVGEKAGSKLAKAESLGIATHDEAWLSSVLAGRAPDAVSQTPAPSVEVAPTSARSEKPLSAPGIEGPLADFFDRLEAIVDELSEDPRVKVGYLRQPPITEAALERIESAWKCELSPAIKNLYRQSNGFTFYWLATHDAGNRRAWAESDLSLFSSICVNRPGRRPTQRAPVGHDVELFPNSGAHGFAWLLPLDKALVRERGYIDFSYAEPDRTIRVFEYGAGGSFPAGFSMEPGEGAPLVLVGDDHGASWNSAPISFETYMENILATYADIRMRIALVDGDGAPEVQIDFESLLPPAQTLATRADGVSFEVDVLELSEVSAVSARAQRIASEYSSALNNMGKKGLGIKAPSKLDRLELATKIAEATADMKALDAKTARSLGSPIYVKTKKALAEKLFCDMPSSMLATLAVKPVFDTTDLGADDFKGFFDYAEGLTKILAEHAVVMSSRVLSAKGSKQRVFSMEAMVEPGHSLEVGQTLTSKATPPGYKLHRHTTCRDYWRQFV